MYDLIYTFNPLDAEKYNLRLFAGGAFPYDAIQTIRDDYYSSDIVWIGKNKNRFRTLNEISKSLMLQGINTKFIVTNETEECSTQYVKVISGNMPYNEYLKYITNSKCLLDIEKDGVGTLRLTETIAYKKTLLTNCKNVTGLPLYNNRQIYVFETNEAINVSFLSLLDNDRISPESISTKQFLNEILTIFGIQN